jgi:hypothetical protein
MSFPLGENDLNLASYLKRFIIAAIIYHTLQNDKGDPRLGRQ